MNEKTASKKNWHVFVRKKFFLPKMFPIIDDKSVIISQQVNMFLCLKDRNLKSENFKLLSWVNKKLLKKIRQGGGKFTSPPPSPPRHNRVKPILFWTISIHIQQAKCNVSEWFLLQLKWSFLYFCLQVYLYFFTATTLCDLSQCSKVFNSNV